MKKLFEGKRKLISIPVIGILSLAFFPIAIGLGLGWLVYKKVGSPKLKYSILTVISLLTLFFGSAWVSAMNSPSKIEKKQEQVIQVIPTPTTEVQTQTLGAETIKEPSPIATTTPKPTESSRQEAKVVKVMVVAAGNFAVFLF